MAADPPVRVHRQNRRGIVMKLTPVGVVVFIPRFLKQDSPQVRRFIAEGLARLGPRATPLDAEQVSPQEIRAMVREWAARIGVQPGRVQLRDMYRKWGSCSSSGSITLNTALCRVPRPLVEYVICHELVHMRVFNHGPDFRTLMSHFIPDWQDRERDLDALLSRQP